MRRIVWTALLVTAGPAAAQPPELPVTKLTVTPAAAPMPALKYELLPELRETTPGNAVTLYYRAFAPEWWHNVAGNKVLLEKVNDALDKPAADVKAMSELRFIRDWMMLKEADRAARRAYCDWEMTPRIREEGIGLLLPDVQSLREIARYLKIRTKLELADGQYDKAARSLQTGLQMGRHCADAPTLIHALVGAALSAVMFGEVEEWIAQPDSPNLYWALGLPQPYIDLRRPLQGERIWMDNMLPGYREALADPSKGPPQPVGVGDLMRLVEGWNSHGGQNLAMSLMVAKKYPAAKEYLRKHGRTAEQVESLPAQSAVLLHEVAIYDQMFDEMLKWQGQPYWITKPALDRVDAELRQDMPSGRRYSLAGMLLPAMSKVHLASARTDRKINLLRTIEALRLYAAAHGQWPNALADITEVPVPIDPISGKVLEYRRDGDKAFLTAPPPAGEPAHQGNSERYEITLKK
jgi:hypothetical protein